MEWENGRINISRCGRSPQLSEGLRSYGNFCKKNNKLERDFKDRSLKVRAG